MAQVQQLQGKFPFQILRVAQLALSGVPAAPAPQEESKRGAWSPVFDASSTSVRFWTFLKSEVIYTALHELMLACLFFFSTFLLLCQRQPPKFPPDFQILKNAEFSKAVILYTDSHYICEYVL